MQLADGLWTLAAAASGPVLADMVAMAHR